MTNTAEQFLAAQGIKFRVVQAKRGPGEWNVTFSRKGGGRLKLDFYQDAQPTAEQVLREMVKSMPDTALPTGSFLDDFQEYKRVTHFFTPAELNSIKEGQG